MTKNPTIIIDGVAMTLDVEEFEAWQRSWDEDFLREWENQREEQNNARQKMFAEIEADTAAYMAAHADDPECNFILTWGDAAGHGFEVHGPFPSHRAMIAYGLAWQDRHGDNPCWQTIYLEDPHAPVRVVAPNSELWFGDNYDGHSADEYGKPRGEG